MTGKRLKSFLVVFSIFYSSATYSAVTKEEVFETLAKYCIGCQIKDGTDRIPTYDPSRTDKPTFCKCDTDAGYIYNKEQRICKLCGDGYAATNFAVDCQPIVCPAGTYREQVSSQSTPCPKGSYRQVLIDKNNTYIKAQ